MSGSIIASGSGQTGATVSKMICPSCCGNQFSIPCCPNLKGKCLQITLICPSGSVSSNIPCCNGQTLSIKTLPVGGPTYPWGDQAAWFHQPNRPGWQFYMDYPCYPNGQGMTGYFRCLQLDCFTSPPSNISTTCAEIISDPTLLDRPFYRLDLFDVYAGTTDRRVISCDPFYWEMTVTDSPIAGNLAFIPHGTRFIVTETPCAGSGGGASGGGSVPSESGPMFSGSVPPQTYTVWFKVCDPYSNNGQPFCLTQTYFVGQPATPPTGYASVSGPFTDPILCGGATMAPCTVSGPAPGSGSVPGSGSGPGSAPGSGSGGGPGGGPAPGSMEIDEVPR
jgi:hypothetical protein